MDFLTWYRHCQLELAAKVATDSDLQAINKITNRNKPTMTKFKYAASCKFKQPYQLASRGSTVFVEADGKSHWSWCFNKFFNRHESPRYLDLTHEQLLTELTKQGFDFFLTPKWDGSCIQVVVDGQGQLHIHTLGSLNDDLPMEAKYTFRNEVLNLLPQPVINYLTDHPYLTLLAEVCTPHNRIITNYAGASSLHYLALVDSDSGLPTITVPDQLVGVINFHPQVWSYSALSTEVDLAAALIQLEVDSDRYGLNPEGVVIYASKTVGSSKLTTNYQVSIPVAKIKCQEYLAILSDRDRKEQLLPGSVEDFKDLQLKVVSGVIDDFDLAPIQQQHVTEFTEWLQQQDELLARLLITIQSCNRKEAAQLLQPIWFRKLLFSHLSATNNNSLPVTISDYLLSDWGNKRTGLQVCQAQSDKWFHKFSC